MDKDAKTKPAGRTGRPPMEADKRKGYSVSFRPRPAVKSLLQAAAEGSGRTLSEEIEHRVEQSFVTETEFGSGDRLAVLRLVASTLRMAEMLTGTSALSSRSAIQETRAALHALFGSMIDGMAKAADAEVDRVSPPGEFGRLAAEMAVDLANDGQVAPIVSSQAKSENPIEAEMRIALETAGPNPVRRQTDTREQVRQSEKVKHD